jgi:hypothetical protein
MTPQDGHQPTSRPQRSQATFSKNSVCPQTHPKVRIFAPCPYSDGHFMIGTALIAFAGEPSMIFELMAR